MQRRPKDVSALEQLTLWHAAAFFVGATWAFGGNADFVQPYLLLAGAAGAAITVAALLLPGESEFRRRALQRLWPFLLLNALTLAALRTPGFRPVTMDGEVLLLPRYVPPWQPSSALPHLTLIALGLFDSAYLTAMNVFMLVRRRRALRLLLAVMTGNAMALAVFGTVQKLSGAHGIFFGAVRSPQAFFFASFVYDNHWGAFVLLLTSALLGLVWYHAYHGRPRDLAHSPALTAGLGVLVLAMSVPLSGARICTVLLLALLAGDFLAWVRRLKRQPGSHVRPTLAAAAAVLALALAGAWYVGRDVYVARIAKTREQVSHLRAEGDVGFRLRLYRDTWRMAEARPWFGWGAGSYSHVFQLYNTARPNPLDRLPRFFHDAHSDWLQAVAEHGLVGAAALALCAVVPLAIARRRAVNNRLSRRLLAGCAVVLGYALIEFPFGNFAVLLTWWLLFLTALRYGILSEQRVDPPAPAPAPGAAPA
ncbi:MAG TPA: O-antigen ligase family protein [Opitutaceae bacterium]|jgi:O-antigen ligase|nr:O-antigen ligase family protein [Opitutaceae bacterium]